MNKTAVIWMIIAVVVIGGIIWLLSSDTAESSSVLEQQNNVDPLLENGRIIDTDTKVFEEIEDAVNALE